VLSRLPEAQIAGRPSLQPAGLMPSGHSHKSLQRSPPVMQKVGSVQTGVAMQLPLWHVPVGHSDLSAFRLHFSLLPFSLFLPLLHFLHSTHLGLHLTPSWHRPVGHAAGASGPR
jgi:hypothetical protein